MPDRCANIGSPRRPQTRDLGPSVRICQINVEGISKSKSEYLSKLLLEHKIDVLNIQETHTRDDQDLNNRGQIPGYTLLKALNHSKYGIATYVRSGSEQTSVIFHDDTADNFIIVVQFADYKIANIYKPPLATWNNGGPPPLAHPGIYIGDFNSHHASWRYASDDENGLMLVQWAESYNLHLVFDAKARGTFHSARWKKDYNPDLAFVTSDGAGNPLLASRAVLKSFPNSQHRPVLLEVGSKIPLTNSVQLPRWNFNRADWRSFANRIDAGVRFIPPLVSNYTRFLGLVLASAKANVCRGFRKEYIPGWNTESERLYKEYQTTGDYTIGTELLQTLDASRKSKWEQTVNSMDFKHSSRKAWRTLNKLTGKISTSQPAPALHPNEIANRIVSVSRAKGDKTETRALKKNMKLLKAGLSSDHDLSKPFTPVEVLHAIRSLQNGKAAGVDGVYNEFLKKLGPNAVKWLSNFFSDILQSGRLPKEFKQSKVVALLKPGKEEVDPCSYRPIALLSNCHKLLERVLLRRIEPFIERVVPVEQAGFRRGRSCTDQVLALTTHLEAGFQNGLKSGAVFVDLTAAYDTVWREGLLFKLLSAVPNMLIVNLISNMLSQRHFNVHLGSKISDVRTLSNGLPQGSVLAPILFNLYIHDLPPTSSRKFIYADDICLVSQNREFDGLERTLSDDMLTLTRYFTAWRLTPSSSKTEVACFHLHNQLSKRELKVSLGGFILRHNSTPKYLGVTLDRSLTFKEHLSRTARKLQTRNNIVQKLTGFTWGASPDVLRTSALSLVYSTAEYAAPVWLGSAHTNKVDVELNRAMRCISGTLSSTPGHWLPVLSRIPPPDLRRKHSLLRETHKIYENPSLPMHHEFLDSTRPRLKSRNPPNRIAMSLLESEFNLMQEWAKVWSGAVTGEMGEGFTPGSVISGHDLPRRDWCNLNRLRTGHGRCAQYRHRCGWIDSPACTCGAEIQDMQHVMLDCPETRFAGDPPLDLVNLNDEAVKWLKQLRLDL